MALLKKKYNPVYLEASAKMGRHTPSKLKLGVSLVIASALLVYPLQRPWYDYRPDFMLIVALYWALQYPRLYKYGFMFAVGLFSDVFQSHLLGVHALIYPLALYVANNIVNIEPKFNAGTQLKTMLMAWVIAVILLCIVFALVGVANPLQPLLTIVPGSVVLLLSFMLLAPKR